MNWSKLTPELKDNVMDIMVDNILVTGDYDFKNRLLSKIGAPVNNGSPSSSAPISKSSFGKSSDYINILIAMSVIAVVIIAVMFIKPGVFPKMS
jgi:hypothetical protein